MSLQVELRKIIDWINSQAIVIRIILWFAAIVFVVIPLAIPVMVIYLIWTALKYREQVK